MLRRAVPFLDGTSKGLPIIDLGAGTGTDLEELWRVAPNTQWRTAVMVDAQQSMLVKIRSRYAGAATPHCVRADATRLPLPTGSAGVVLSVGTLCCVADYAIGAVIDETTRILAPGGILILSVPPWRGRADERATEASGLYRLLGGRPGRAVFQKHL